MEYSLMKRSVPAFVIERLKRPTAVADARYSVHLRRNGATLNVPGHGGDRPSPSYRLCCPLDLSTCVKRLEQRQQRKAFPHSRESLVNNNTHL